MKRTRRHRVMRWAAVGVPLSLLLGVVTTFTIARIPSPEFVDDAEFRGGRLPGKGKNYVARARYATQDLYHARLSESMIEQYGMRSSEEWLRLMVKAIETGEHGDAWSDHIGFGLSNGSPPNEVYVCLITYGWPARSFYGLFAIEDGINSRRRVLASSEDAWALPCAPGSAIWWPLALNTVGFAVPWLVLLSLSQLLIAGVRRRHRTRRGRCPGCNYDRAGLAAGAVCPECGEASAVRSQLKAGV